jgi:hypothetical protein
MWTWMTYVPNSLPKPDVMAPRWCWNHRVSHTYWRHFQENSNYSASGGQRGGWELQIVVLPTPHFVSHARACTAIFIDYPTMINWRLRHCWIMEVTSVVDTVLNWCQGLPILSSSWALFLCIGFVIACVSGTEQPPSSLPCGHHVLPILL